MSISSHLSSYQKFQNDYFYKQLLKGKNSNMETFPMFQNNDPSDDYVKVPRENKQAPRQTKNNNNIKPTKQSNMKPKNSNMKQPPKTPTNSVNHNNQKKQVNFDDMDENDDFNTNDLSLHNQLYDNSKDNEYAEDIDLGDEDSYSEEEDDYEDEDMMNFIDDVDETKEQDSILNDLRGGFEPMEETNSKKRARPAAKKAKTTANTNIVRK